MALAVHYPFSIVSFLTILASFALLLTCSHCFNPKVLNLTRFDQSSNPDWSPAGATWYGSPNGGGSDGGACGYLDAVEQPPYSAMVSAGGPSIYQSGEGCGVCYEVKCIESVNVACSGNPVIVTITDECPGCTSESTHFDLSGKAFGALAKPGLAGQLRNVGVLQIQNKRVNCNYPGTTVVIRVDLGSTPYYFAAAVEDVDEDGILKSVELAQQSGEWLPMKRSSGAVWKLDTGGYALQPPFSLRLTEESGQAIVLKNVIPIGWKPGQTYRSLVNFKS